MSSYSEFIYKWLLSLLFMWYDCLMFLDIRYFQVKQINKRGSECLLYIFCYFSSTTFFVESVSDENTLFDPFSNIVIVKMYPWNAITKKSKQNKNIFEYHSDFIFMIVCSEIENKMCNKKLRIRIFSIRPIKFRTS